MPHSRVLKVLLFLACWKTMSSAAAKPHVIVFGKWITVPWYQEMAAKPIPLQIRALFVDTRLREYTLGAAHEITDRLFIVRRAFRVNDSLPDEPATVPRWLWQRGGWLLVDRVTGRVSPVNLPEFDGFYSATSWYRDYAAYCGVSDDGKKLYAIVAQIGRRKPVLRKPLPGGEIADDAPPDSACPEPAWQRGPARVSFEPTNGEKQTFAIRGHVVDVVNDPEEEEEAAK